MLPHFSFFLCAAELIGVLAPHVVMNLRAKLWYEHYFIAIRFRFYLLYAHAIGEISTKIFKPLMLLVINNYFLYLSKQFGLTLVQNQISELLMHLQAINAMFSVLRLWFVRVTPLRKHARFYDWFQK